MYLIRLLFIGCHMSERNTIPGHGFKLRSTDNVTCWYCWCLDVPLSVWRVCCNPVYLCIILGACSHVTLVGFATFLTKYLQAHFGITAALASIYTGSLRITAPS